MDESSRDVYTAFFYFLLNFGPFVFQILMLFLPYRTSMASFLRFGHGAKAAVFAAGVTTIAGTQIAFAKEKSFFDDENLENAVGGSYDPNAIVPTQAASILAAPDRMGTPKQKFSALQHSIEPIAGLRLRYVHKAPTNEVELNYDVLNENLPKYGNVEAVIRAGNIECTRDLVGNMSAQFEVPYLPVMMYVKDSHDGNNMMVAQSALPLSPSSITLIKLMSSDQAGNQLTCSFNQSLTPSLSAGTEVTLLLGPQQQAFYSFHMNHHGMTPEGFISDFGVEVNSRLQTTMSYIRPVYNGLVLGAQYNLDLMAGKSDVAGIARLRTENTRTTVSINPSAGQLSSQVEYVYNKNIKIVGNMASDLSAKSRTAGLTIEFGRVIEGTLLYELTRASFRYSIGIIVFNLFNCCINFLYHFFFFFVLRFSTGEV